MAFELNDNGIDVAFLPELLSDVCADSLIKMGNIESLISNIASPQKQIRFQKISNMGLSKPIA